MPEQLTLQPNALTPVQALTEYLSYDADEYRIGSAPIPAMERYRATFGRAQDLPPPLAHIAGSMMVECAMAHRGYGGVKQPEASPHKVGPALDDAEDSFRVARKGASGMAKVEAMLDLAALPMYRHATFFRRAPDLDETYERWYKQYIEVVQNALHTHQKNPDISHLPFLRTLTAIGGLSSPSFNSDGIIVLPLPLRGRGSLASPDTRSHFYFWAVKQGNLLPVRVGNTAIEKSLVVSPQSFLNEEFDTPHGQGTLQAVVRRAAAERRLQKVSGRSRTTTRPEEEHAMDHLQRVDSRMTNDLSESFRLHIAEDDKHDMANRGEGVEASEWYESLPPRIDPYFKDEEKFETYVGEQTSEYWAKKLDQSAVVNLAWMTTELALGYARVDKSEAAKDYFEAAADLFHACCKGIEPEDGTRSAEMFQLVWAGAATHMRKAICLKDAELEEPLEIEAVADWYQSAVTTFAGQALQHYDWFRQENNAAVASQLKLVLQELTAALLLMDKEIGTIVMPAAPRQKRGAGGFDLQLYARDREQELKPDLVGRLRLADAPNVHSLNHDVLTIAGDELLFDDDMTLLRTYLAQKDAEQKDSAILTAQQRLAEANFTAEL